MNNIAICGGREVDRVQTKSSLRQYLKMRGLLYNIDLYVDTQEFIQKEKSYDILYLSSVAQKDAAELNKTLRERNPWIRIIYLLRQREAGEIIGQIHAHDDIKNPFSKAELLNTLKTSLEYLHHEKVNKKITFRNGVDFLCFNPEEIYYIESIKKHKLRIVTKRGIYEMRYMMKAAYEKTQKYGFEQSHRSCIVNMLYVAEITGNLVYLINKAHVPLAKMKAEMFKDAVERYMRGGVRG